MPVSDVDLELLEAHLDRELNTSDEQELLTRLQADPALAAELIALQSQRVLRSRAFDSMHGDALTASRIQMKVRQQINRDALWGERVRILRYVGSAAAVIMISFYAGWVGKARIAGPSPSSPFVSPVSSPASALATSAAPAQQQLPAQQLIAANDAAPAVNVMNPQRASQPDAVDFSRDLPHFFPRPLRYQVNLTDPFGHIVEVRQFDTLDDARAFSEQFARWQRQQQQPPQLPQQTPEQNPGAETEPVIFK
jgi:anti-sigma factor RsiW